MGSGASSDNGKQEEKISSDIDSKSPFDDIPMDGGTNITENLADAQGKPVSAAKLKKMALGQQGYKDQHRDYDSTLAQVEFNKTDHVNWEEAPGEVAQKRFGQQPHGQAPKYANHDATRMEAAGRGGPAGRGPGGGGRGSSTGSKPPPPRQPPKRGGPANGAPQQGGPVMAPSSIAQMSGPSNAPPARYAQQHAQQQAQQYEQQQAQQQANYQAQQQALQQAQQTEQMRSSPTHVASSAQQKTAKLSAKLNPKYNAPLLSATPSSVKTAKESVQSVKSNKQPNLHFVELSDDSSEDDDEDQNSTDGGLVYDWTAFNDDDDNKEYFAPDSTKVPKMQPLSSSVESLPFQKPDAKDRPPPVHKESNVAIVDHSGDYDEDGCLAANFSSPSVVQAVESVHKSMPVPGLNIGAKAVAKPKAPPIGSAGAGGSPIKTTAPKPSYSPAQQTGPFHTGTSMSTNTSVMTVDSVNRSNNGQYATPSSSVNGKPQPPPLHNKFAVKETIDVKRNKAQMPSNLNHAKPTRGDWLKKRYIVNNYILLDTLGTGSYGEVRLCKERTSDLLYAIKIISKDFLKKKKNGHTSETFFEDIRREIAIMKKLTHPNVLRLYEVLDDPNVNKMYLVLEYMKKGDLINVLKKREEALEAGEGNGTDQTPTKRRNSKQPSILPDHDVWNIFRQTVAGVRYLHYQNVVHGDIKPQNLLVSDMGVVKIADFGISKMLNNTDDTLAEGAGTPAFMSPELCSGESFSGQLADVWALGATMFMLKFGNPPWVSGNLMQLYYKIQNDPLEFPSVIDDALKSLLVGMMIKDPKERFSLKQVLMHPWLSYPPAPPQPKQTPNAKGPQPGTNNNQFFAPPESYQQEQDDAMKGPMIFKSVDDEEMFMSIGLRTKPEKKKSGEKGLGKVAEGGENDEVNIGEIDEEGDDWEEVEYEDSDDEEVDGDDDDMPPPKTTAKAEAKEEKEEVHHDIMATNWGDDVFEMVGGSSDEDDDSEDEVDEIPEPAAPKSTNLPASNGAKPTEHKADNKEQGNNSSYVHVEMSRDEEERRVRRFNMKTKKKSQSSLLNVSVSGHHFDGSGDSDDDVVGVNEKGKKNNLVNMFNGALPGPKFKPEPVTPERDSKFVSPPCNSASSSKSTVRKLASFNSRGKYDEEDDEEDDCEDLTQVSIGEFGDIMDTLAMQPGKRLSPEDMTACSSSGAIIANEFENRQLEGAHSNSHNGIKVACHSEQGKRSSQEDRVNVVANVAKMHSLKGQKLENGVKEILHKFTIACVFDGHNGDRTSQYMIDHFSHALALNERFISSKHISNVMSETCVQLDNDVSNILKENEDVSGSTGVVMVYDGRKHMMTVANVGDSSCIICRNGRAVRLLRMHRMSDEKERERVIASGGKVISNRVNGILAVSRSFGDVEFKDHKFGSIHTSPTLNAVIPLPDVVTEEITPMTEFAVLGTDGLFDIMEPQLVVNFVKKCLNKKADLQKTAEMLVKEALAVGSVDNVSAIIVAFHCNTVSV